MVWARTKIMIHDDLLRPIPKMIIRYEGHNPEKFYKEIHDLILVTFRVSEHSVQEKEFHWFKGTPEKFKIKWEVNKDLDKFSYYWIQVSLDGEVHKTKGKANISVEGALRTEYPQDTYWQRNLLFEFLRRIWHVTFYSGKRDEYLREGRRMLSMFVNELKVLTRV